MTLNIITKEVSELKYYLTSSPILSGTLWMHYV